METKDLNFYELFSEKIERIKYISFFPKESPISIFYFYYLTFNKLFNHY